MSLRADEAWQRRIQAADGGLRMRWWCGWAEAAWVVGIAEGGLSTGSGLTAGSRSSGAGLVRIGVGDEVCWAWAGANDGSGDDGEARSGAARLQRDESIKLGTGSSPSFFSLSSFPDFFLTHLFNFCTRPLLLIIFFSGLDRMKTSTGLTGRIEQQLWRCWCRERQRWTWRGLGAWP
ncbi:hypothetical protein M0R45_025921 [Rubus argutus]|uniref:Uncharacterized protein n=1 Tax=Rubus argutus TaxID=59490 RepID=A0AAW1WVZ1_RUBAR